MTAAATTPLPSKFGPIVADAAGTITVQEASDVLDCSRLRVCALLNVTARRVLVTDVLALVPPSSLEAAPAAKLVRYISAPMTPTEAVAARTSSRAGSTKKTHEPEQRN